MHGLLCLFLQFRVGLGGRFLTGCKHSLILESPAIGVAPPASGLILSTSRVAHPASGVAPDQQMEIILIIITLIFPFVDYLQPEYNCAVESCTKVVINPFMSSVPQKGHWQTV